MWSEIDSGGIETPSNWQPQTMFINEAGLYQLMLRSKKREAVVFRRWVTRKVLPSLRNSLVQLQQWRAENAAQIDSILAPVVGFVYVATNSDLTRRGIYKIGMTTNLDDRRVQLNTGSIYDFEFVFSFETFRYRELEKHLHVKFVNQRVLREFFYLSSKDIDCIGSMCRDFERN